MSITPVTLCLEECFICMEMKQVFPTKCIVTSLIHEGYMCCIECQERWYRGHPRCIVCNQEVVVPRTDQPSNRRNPYVYYGVILLYMVTAYWLLHLVTEEVVCVKCGSVKYQN